MFNFVICSFYCIVVNESALTILFIFSDTVFTMNSDEDIKLEEDPVSRSEIKTEPQVNYKFFILCFVLSLLKTVH